MDEKQVEKPSNDFSLLTLEEAANILKVHIDTVKRYTKRAEKPLPTVVLSQQQVRVKKDDLESWIDSLKE